MIIRPTNRGHKKKVEEIKVQPKIVEPKYKVVEEKPIVIEEEIKPEVVLDEVTSLLIDED